MGSWALGIKGYATTVRHDATLRRDATTLRRYAPMRKIAKNIKIKHKKCQNYKKL
jgi:hypothetical protein